MLPELRIQRLSFHQFCPAYRTYALHWLLPDQLTVGQTDVTIECSLCSERYDICLSHAIYTGAIDTPQSKKGKEER